MIIWGKLTSAILKFWEVKKKRLSLSIQGWVIYRQGVKANSSIGIDHWPIGQQKYVNEKRLYEIHSKFVHSIVRLNLKRREIPFEHLDQSNYHLELTERWQNQQKMSLRELNQRIYLHYWAYLEDIHQAHQCDIVFLKIR
jgi:hypothetical protein